MRTAAWIAFAVLIGAADRASACSCLFSSPCGLYSATDAVFLGKVLDVRIEGSLQAAQLEVTRVWKGTVDPVVTVTNPAGSSCSFDFVSGTRFVVYGGGSGSTSPRTCAPAADNFSRGFRSLSCRRSAVPSPARS